MSETRTHDDVLRIEIALGGCYNARMVWFFARGTAKVRLETRVDDASGEYVLDISWPDRPSQTERFTDLDTFRTRVLALEDQLAAERWTQVGQPTILPHGWRGPFTN